MELTEVSILYFQIVLEGMKQNTVIQNKWEMIIKNKYFSNYKVVQLK